MSRLRFADVASLLEWMLDTYERQPHRKAPIIGYIDYDAIPTRDALQRVEGALKTAERAGAVRIEYGRSPLERHEIERVRLDDVDALYRHLGRERAAESAARAIQGLQEIVAGRPTLVAQIPEELEAGWSRRAALYGLAPGDSEGAHQFLLLLCGFLDGKHQDVDQRTFCRRATGDSKALERKGQAGRVAHVLTRLYDLEPGEPSAVLELVGIRKFPSPVCLRGPVSIGSGDAATALSSLRPYAAFAPDLAETLQPVARPGYLLSIENFASFNRQAREIQDDGLLLYTGGFPSRAVRTALCRLDALLPEDVPFFHWGDIDPWGLKIFRNIEESLHRPLRPHLMDGATADLGMPAQASAEMRRLAETNSAIASMAAQLGSADARHLEQEELDPITPEVRSTPGALAGCAARDEKRTAGPHAQ